MIGGHDSSALGWNDGSQVRAWTSRSDPFRASENLFSESWPGWRQLDAHARGELRALLPERNPDLLYRNLLGLAKRQAQDGQIQAAAALLTHLVETLPPPVRSLRDQAMAQLSALQGRGKMSDQIEGVLSRFSRETLHPAGLAGFFVGGTVFRMTRLASLSRLASLPGTSLFAQPFTARAVAGLAGLAAEIPALTFTGQAAAGLMGTPTPAFGKDVASAALLLAPVRGAAYLTKGSAWGSLAAINAGHFLQERAGLRSLSGDGFAFFTDSLLTYLQFEVGARFSAGLLGPGYARMSRSLDIQAKFFSKSPPSFPLGFHAAGGPAYEWVSAGRGERAPRPSHPLIPLETRLPRDLHISRMEGEGSGGVPEPVKRELVSRYEQAFPAPSETTYSEEILAAVLRTHAELPNFHERLLEYLAQSSGSGSREQYYRVLALEDVFDARALSTPTASWDWALLELVVGQTLADDNPLRRRHILNDLFKKWDAGLTRETLQNLLRHHRLGEKLQAFPTPDNSHFDDFYLRHWPRANQIWGPPSQGGYPGIHRPMLLHFVYHYSQSQGVLPFRVIRILEDGRRSGIYEPGLIDAVLQAAATHPQGLLILQRMFQVFAVGDLPAKLQEIVDPAPREDWLFLSQSLPENSAAETEMARNIDGTALTGYFQDEAVARRILRVGKDIAEWEKDPVRKKENRKDFISAFWRATESGRPLQPSDYLRLLETYATPDTKILRAAWENRRFSLEILPDQEYDRWTRRAALRSPSNVSLFVYGKRHGEPDRILVRRPPPVDLQSPGGQNAAFQEGMNRLDAINHEFDHLRRFRPEVEAGRGEGIRIPILNITREGRLKSEVLAYLAEVRWRAPHLSSPFLEIARLLNQPLPLYLRNVADISYFSKENEEKLRSLR